MKGEGEELLNSLYGRHYAMKCIIHAETEIKAVISMLGPRQASRD